MEKAFHNFGREQLVETRHVQNRDWRLAHAYGLSSGLLAMSQVWQRRDNTQDCIVAAKGAPEAIADLAHLSDAERLSVRRSVERNGGRRLARIGHCSRLFLRNDLADIATRFRIRVSMRPGRAS